MGRTVPIITITTTITGNLTLIFSCIVLILVVPLFLIFGFSTAAGRYIHLKIKFGARNFTMVFVEGTGVLVCLFIRELCIPCGDKISGKRHDYESQIEQ